MRNQVLCAAIVASLFAAGAGTAQTVTGRLIDADSGEPIAGARVVAVADGDVPLTAVITDPRGGFRLDLRAPGSIHLRAERIGYVPTTLGPVTVGANETVEIEMAVALEAIALDSLVATAEARPWWETQRPRAVWPMYQRIDRFGPTGAGRFISAADLESQRRSPAWMILSRPVGFGLRAESPRRGSSTRAITMPGRFGGRCRPVYFLDGIPNRAEEWTVHAMIERLVEEGRIEGIEIFGGEYIPPEFEGMLRQREGCVVAVWTRRPGDPPRPP